MILPGLVVFMNSTFYFLLCFFLTFLIGIMVVWPNYSQILPTLDVPTLIIKLIIQNFSSEYVIIG